MDVRLRGAQGRRGDAAPTAKPLRPLGPAQIARILGQRQDAELLIARRFTECRGLSPEQLEDLYQDTAAVLLHRPYQDEKHLCDALRRGIKHRALNLSRDERRRQEILANSAPGRHALERARSAEQDPEHVALARQDRLVITAFLAKLTSDERQVFWLFAEGAGYNRIAKSLGIPVNQARNTLAACERKRERFQRAFGDQAAAMFPAVLLQRMGRLGWAAQHARMLAWRLQPRWVSFGQGGIRERATALLAGGGASTKIAATILTTAVIAGSTIAATHTLAHHPSPPNTRVPTHPAALTRTPQRAPSVPSTVASIVTRHTRPATPAHQPHNPGHVALATHHAPRHTREPGGFAYLGVPATNPPVSATSAALRSTQPPPAATQTGGPFSP